MARASYSTTPLLRSLVHRPQGVILVPITDIDLNVSIVSVTVHYYERARSAKRVSTDIH